MRALAAFSRFVIGLCGLWLIQWGVDRLNRDPAPQGWVGTVGSVEGVLGITIGIGVAVWGIGLPVWQAVKERSRYPVFRPRNPTLNPDVRGDTVEGSSAPSSLRPRMDMMRFWRWSALRRKSRGRRRAQDEPEEEKRNGGPPPADRS